ncbi:MAG: hypothetical protein V4819_17880, partial [Verrucomicrobiota bacterium]
MKKTAFFALFSASFGLLSANTAVDCIALSLSVKTAVAAEQSKVLEIVSKEVAAAPTCACEVVKAAIEGSNASVQTVAAIVEASATAAPDQMRAVSQCAVAVAPDALAAVQAVVAKLDPNLGETGSSAKSAKGGVAEVASMPNPLDFPGEGPVGPTPGGPGGFPLIPHLPPVIIAPPDQSNVDPG